MNKRKNLTDHLKETEFWFDLILLGFLWLGVNLLPENLELYAGIKLSYILKIVALVSSLEAISFFSILFLGKRAGLMLQGFVGGFVSSTMTYLRFTRNSEMSLFSSALKTRALLYSTIAMLLEGVLIILAVLPQSYLLCLPFLTQALILFICSRLIKPQAQDLLPFKDEHVLIKEPIIWKKVFYLSSLIFTLIYVMELLNSKLSLSLFWSSLVISLFEAHAVLIAGLSQFKQQENFAELSALILAILTGNVISKSYFILRAKDKKIKTRMLLYLFSSLGGAICVSLIFL